MQAAEGDLADSLTSNTRSAPTIQPRTLRALHPSPQPIAPTAAAILGAPTAERLLAPSEPGPTGRRLRQVGVVRPSLAPLAEAVQSTQAAEFGSEPATGSTGRRLHQNILGAVAPGFAPLAEGEAAGFGRRLRQVGEAGAGGVPLVHSPRLAPAAEAASPAEQRELEGAVIGAPGSGRRLHQGGLAPLETRLAAAAGSAAPSAETPSTLVGRRRLLQAPKQPSPAERAEAGMESYMAPAAEMAEAGMPGTGRRLQQTASQLGSQAAGMLVQRQPALLMAPAAEAGLAAAMQASPTAATTSPVGRRLQQAGQTAETLVQREPALLLAPAAETALVTQLAPAMTQSPTGRRLQQGGTLLPSASLAGVSPTTTTTSRLLAPAAEAFLPTVLPAASSATPTTGRRLAQARASAGGYGVCGQRG